MGLVNDDKDVEFQWELDDKDAKSIVRLTEPSNKDVFYDLGSGHGKLVRYFIKKTKVRQSIGLEYDLERFCASILRAFTELSKSELKRIDFWRTCFEKYDFSRATILYMGLDEVCYDKKYDSAQFDLFDKHFSEKEIKIVKRDMPLVGYKPVTVIRSKKNSWFFLMKTPLKNYRVKSLDEWLYHVFNTYNKTKQDLATHYGRQYAKKDIRIYKYEIRDFKRNFTRIAKNRFSKI